MAFTKIPKHPPSGAPRIPLFAKVLALAASYVLFACAGHKFGTVSSYFTFVWPPTGVVLAILLSFGTNLWPGVFIGSFVFDHLIYGTPFLAAMGVASGNTIGALAAIYCLQRAINFKTIEDSKSAIGFIVLGGSLNSIISATLGTLSLWEANAVAGSDFWRIWMGWCLGDIIGVLVLAPILLVLFESKVSSLPKDPKKILETLFLAMAVFFLSLTTFTDLWPQLQIFHLPYFLFPVLVWSAMRFRLLGATFVTFFIGAFGFWGTSNGLGFFAAKNLSDGLFHFQMFLGVISVTGLVFASVINDWRKAEKELRESQEKLREAVNSRDEFLSIASHELKTPITSLKMQIQLIQRKMNSKDNTSPTSERFTQALEVSSKQTDRLVDLIDKLLDVVRIQAGRLDYSYQPVNLLEVITEIEQQFEAQLNKSKCLLKIDVDPNINGYWDKCRIEQVLVNLISNAIKYAPGEEILVRGTCKNGDPEIVVLVVEDKGPGIPPERQDFLFERFSRATNLRHISGLGLGLFIVKKIIEGHHGTVNVKSIMGHGTQFIVELPSNMPKSAGHGAVQ